MSEYPTWDRYGQQGQQDSSPPQGQPQDPSQYRGQASYQGQLHGPHGKQSQPEATYPKPPGGRAGHRSLRKSWPRRHRILTGLGGGIVLIIIGSIVAAVGANHQASPPASTAGAAAAASSAAAPPSPPPPIMVEFIVSGSAPDGINMTYGPAGKKLRGPSVLQRTAKMTVSFDPSVLHYALRAQLHGDGDITCQIVVTGLGEQALTVSSGAASGGHKICSIQAWPEKNGLVWANEN